MPPQGTLVFCDFVWPKAVDGAKTTLLGLITAITTPRLPALMLGPNLFWQGSFRDGLAGAVLHFKVLLVRPSGDSSTLVGADVGLQDPDNLINFQQAVPPVELREAGWHHFEAYLGEVLVGTAEFKVEVTA